MAAAVYWPELNLCVFVYNRDTRVKIVLGKSCLEDNFPTVNVPDFTLRQSVMETDKAEIPGNFDIIFGNASISCIKFSSGIMRRLSSTRTVRILRCCSFSRTLPRRRF